VCASLSFYRACSPAPTPLFLSRVLPCLHASFSSRPLSSRRCTRRSKGIRAWPSSPWLHLAAVPAHEGGDKEDAHLLYMGAPLPIAPRRMSAQAHSVSEGKLRDNKSRCRCAAAFCRESCSRRMRRTFSGRHRDATRALMSFVVPVLGLTVQRPIANNNQGIKRLGCIIRYP
jgi:hypothetical protein